MEMAKPTWTPKMPSLPDCFAATSDSMAYYHAMFGREDEFPPIAAARVVTDNDEADRLALRIPSRKETSFLRFQDLPETHLVVYDRDGTVRGRVAFLINVDHNTDIDEDDALVSPSLDIRITEIDFSRALVWRNALIGIFAMMINDVIYKIAESARGRKTEQHALDVYLFADVDTEADDKTAFMIADLLESSLEMAGMTHCERTFVPGKMHREICL